MPYYCDFEILFGIVGVSFGTRQLENLKLQTILRRPQFPSLSVEDTLKRLKSSLLYELAYSSFRETSLDNCKKAERVWTVIL